MSFGVSITDVLTVLQLARDTVQNCRAAPSVFAEASRVSESLANLLEGVEIEYKKPDSPLHHDERTRTDFAIHFKNCQNSMEPMARYIARYSSLGGSQVKLKDRFTFSKKVYIDLRFNLAFYTSKLSEFLQLVGLGALGRIEKKVGDVKDFLPQVMNRLDHMYAEIQIMGDKESLLSEHPDDTKTVWKNFRSKLIQSGFNSNILQQHQAEIFLYIRELAKSGTLQSDVASSTGSDDESWLQPTRVYRMPPRWRAGSHSSEDEAYSSDALTPRDSRSSLRRTNSRESLRKSSRGRNSSEQELTRRSSKRKLRAKGSTDAMRTSRRRETEPAVDTPLLTSRDSGYSSTSGAGEERQQGSSPLRLDPSMPRIWRNPRGDVIEKGTFVSQENEFIVLHDNKKDEVKIPLGNLSPADLDALEFLQGQRRAPESANRVRKRSRSNPQSPSKEVLAAGEDEVIDIPRRVKPEIRVGKRTNVVPGWHYRTEAVLPTPSYSSGSIYSDSLPNAAGAGRLDRVKELLHTGSHIEATGPKSWTETHTKTDAEGNTTTSHTRHSYPETTALYRAAYAGHLKTACYLLTKGANVNTRDGYDGKEGELILFKAIRNGAADIVRLLLEYGARQTNDLLRYGAPGRSASTTALQVACEYPKRGIVRDLLDYGADIDVATPRVKETPLFIASKNGFAGIVQLLLGEGAKVSTYNRDGATPLYKACGRGYGGVVRHLLRYGADPSIGRGSQGETAMYKAAWENHLDVVDHLLDFEADVNIRNDSEMKYRDNQQRIFHGILAGLSEDRALMNGWSKMPLHAAAHKGNRQMVELLISGGADIEAMGKDEMTPMYLAAKQKHESTVMTLRRAGAQLETEKHDPVLALLTERNDRRNGTGARSTQLTVLEQQRQNMARHGTSDFWVGLLAEVTRGVAQSRRGML